ncbi:hypothetical protein SAMN04488688_1169 [Paenibacillus sp. cl141a]|nr:hypothetical protein SAMN04488688_1169 [Paenibacillus sp. cl141a]
MTELEVVDVDVNLSKRGTLDKVHTITNQIPELYPSIFIYRHA